MLLLNDSSDMRPRVLRKSQTLILYIRSEEDTSTDHYQIFALCRIIVSFGLIYRIKEVIFLPALAICHLTTTVRPSELSRLLSLLFRHFSSSESISDLSNAVLSG